MYRYFCVYVNRNLPAPSSTSGRTPTRLPGVRRGSNSSSGSSSGSSSSSSSSSSSGSDSDSEYEDMDSRLNLLLSQGAAQFPSLQTPSPITPAPEPTQPLSSLGTSKFFSVGQLCVWGLGGRVRNSPLCWESLSHTVCASLKCPLL